MASVSTDSTGNRTIYFVGSGRKRLRVRIGKLSMKMAASIQARIEHLAAAKTAGHSIDPETAQWLAKIDDKLYAKLAKVGLVEHRAEVEDLTLAAFIDAYLATRSDLKPRTRINFGQVKGFLVGYFGANCRLADITAGDADEWRRWLGTHAKLGKNTIRRHCGRAKQLYRVALRKKIVAFNPFGDMGDTNVKANRERDYFVTRDDAKRVLDACPSTQWRLLFALSRFGGLRCPSEHRELTWGDIDWQRGRMTVRSPKTEHHENKASRTVPIFPELRPHLEAVYGSGGRGPGEYVITIANLRRDKYANPRTRFEKIIRRAGLTPWPKLFQNLRASRETELAETYPLHVVCEWIGNSQPVAMKHYLQVTEQHFEQATRGGADSGAVECKSVAQIQAQPAAAEHCQASQKGKSTRQNKDDLQRLAMLNNSLQTLSVPRTGFEPVTLALGKRCSIL
jgi:integrase